MSKKQNNQLSFADSIDKGYYEIYDIKRGGLANCRDLGNLVTETGQKIKSRRLLRSGKLCKLNKKEIEILKEAGVKTIIDLRIDNEIENHPDTKIDGVKYHHVPLICYTLPGITREKSMYRVMKDESALLKRQFADKNEYMKKLYEMIVFSPNAQKQLKRVLEIILNAKGCVLWHCAGGKDRAGIVSMLVEGLLNVSDEDIIKDYLASQQADRLKKNLQKLGLTVCAIFSFNYKFKDILFAMLDAKAEYISHVLHQIKEKYGSIENYCIEALKIPPDLIISFRQSVLG